MSYRRWIFTSLLVAFMATTLTQTTFAQEDEEEPGVLPAPDRPENEGEGPFDRLILRGGILIDGTGAPARGPVDIVIEKNRITRVESVGNPGYPIDEDGRPEAAEGDKEIDVSGMYILPGLVDMHGHM